MKKLKQLNSAGAWLPVGHGKQPPALPKLFGPSRFTPQQQAANPSKPMTRLVKDVLRVGKWKVGYDAAGKPELWACNRQTLNELAANVKQAQANGVAFNLAMSHGDEATGLVPTDELIAPLDAVVAAGDVLWCSVYVTPEQAKFLRNPAMKVSAGIRDDWDDGEGRNYSMILAHVAVTDHPVVTGQGPFVDLSNKQTLSKTRNLSMDFAALVESINALLALVNPSAKLPEDTSEENVVERLTLVMSIIGGGEAPETTTETGTGETMEGSPNDGTPLSLTQDKQFANMQKAFQNAVAPLQAEIKSLSNTVQELKTDKANAAKSAFMARTLSLGHAGVPAATLEKLKALGAAHGYDLSLCDMVENTAKLSTTSRAKTLANASPAPLSTGDKPARSNEDIATSLKARGIDPKFMPGYVPSTNGKG